MTFVTVFRRVPKPITGMIGILYDPEFERFEANLDWLETTGWNKMPPAPLLPPEVAAGTRARYVEAFEKLTGERFSG